MTTNSLLIYGANGYTGQLICREAKRLGLTPILAGRNAAVIADLAKSYGWPWKHFSLDSTEVIAGHLQGITAVLHCAGPFRHTAKNMLNACLQTGVHYLDITGEMEVFAQAEGLHEAALQKGIMLMPGTGFDVVPTDCMALHLKQQMPDATTLHLAFVNRGGQISHGTAMSMSEKLGEGGASRIDGKITREPLGKLHRYIEVAGKNYLVMSIPWGDVFTAYHTTGIPNIHAYTGMKPSIVKLMQWQRWFNPILRSNWFRKWLQSRINKRPAGPSDEQRSKAWSQIWGEATNAKGESIVHHFRCPDGYTLTAITAVHIAHLVLQGNFKPGYQTPAGCYGLELMKCWQ